MDKSSLVVIHANYLKNQALYAQYLKYGFSRLGYDCVVTSDPKEDGDVHVCIGPHFALNNWLDSDTIYIDRCLWGDDLEAVTIGWINPEGGMIYPDNAPGDRCKPSLKPWKQTESKPLFLFDFIESPSVIDQVRRVWPNVVSRAHPAMAKGPLEPLELQLNRHDLVIGHKSSALVTAVINGNPVISLDSRSSVRGVCGMNFDDIIRPNRDQWLNNMSYAQWKGSEIQSGEALEYVINCK